MLFLKIPSVKTRNGIGGSKLHFSPLATEPAYEVSFSSDIPYEVFSFSETIPRMSTKKTIQFL